MTAPVIFLCVLLAVGYWLLADRASWYRMCAYAALLLCAGAMCALAFGVPRPSALLLRPMDGTLRGVVLSEHRAIFVWLTTDGNSAPLALRLPWSDQAAAQLERAMAEGQRTGRKVRLHVGRRDGNGTGDGRGTRGGAGDSLPGNDAPITVRLAPVAPIVAKDMP